MTNEIVTSELKPEKRMVSRRDIGINVFELSDGNVQLESTFLDTYHLIRLDIFLDPKTRTILSATSEYVNYPHTLCSLLSSKAKTLVGLQIGRGITKEVIKRIGGGEGCVHLRELALDSINFAATVLMGYNDGFGLMSREFNNLDEYKRYDMSKGVLKNTCYVYKEKKEEEEVVATE